jgi:hypothetical protein
MHDRTGLLMGIIGQSDHAPMNTTTTPLAMSVVGEDMIGDDDFRKGIANYHLTANYAPSDCKCIPCLQTPPSPLSHPIAIYLYSTRQMSMETLLKCVVNE